MKWITILILILSASAVFADDGLIENYLPKQQFDLGVHASNVTGELVGANCSVQIRNLTYNVILDGKMNELGGGWYNFTYNQSQTGKYYCRVNCTQGDQYVANTCDFVIARGSEVEIAIILIMAIVLTFLIVLYRLVQVQAIKYLIMSVAVMTLILTINIGMILAKDNLPLGVQSLLITNYQIVLWTMEFIMGLGGLFLMGYYVVKLIPTITNQIKNRGK